MNKKLANILIISAKSAVNALLTNTAMTVFFPQLMGWHTGSWWINVGKVALATVVGREATVWGPVLLKWSENLNASEGDKT